MTAATAKQTSYIVSLANEITGRADAHLAQVEALLPVSKAAVRRGLTSAEATACIDHLVAKKAAAPKPTTVVTASDGAPTPQQILDAVLSGATVEITSSKTGKVYRTAIEGLYLDQQDGIIRVLTVASTPGKVSVANIASWDVLA